MRLDDLTGRRVVLLGLGSDVTSALPSILEAEPLEVRLVFDGDDPDLERARAVGAADLGRLDLDEAGHWAEVFVRAPGFPRYQDPLVDALARGARMTTPVDLWMGSIGVDRTVVGVTGTKGKSTVSELIGRLGPAHGLRVGVAGNLGPPVFSHDWDREATVVALEVSSYQAADLHHVPRLAVVPYLAEDHLSWHGGVERYVADKLRLLRNEGGTAGEILVAEASGRAVEAIEALGLTVDVVPAPPTPAEVPAHRAANAALAAAVLARLGGPVLTDDEVIEAARSSLPGRLDLCDGPPGLLCVDDALASNPTATAAALAWLRGLDRPTVVLLGGADRGVDVAPLALEVSRWSRGALRVVALPDTGADLAARCGAAVVTGARSVTEAVELALAEVEPDGAVLFSPAAPTPPRFGNWQVRSDQFRSALAAAVAR